MRFIRIFLDNRAGYYITSIRRFGKVLAEAGGGVMVSTISYIEQT